MLPRPRGVWYARGMKAPVPALFDRDKSFSPAAQSLRSRKREAYCQEIAGECWGNNTEAYCRAFGVADRAAASASAMVRSVRSTSARLVRMVD